MSYLALDNLVKRFPSREGSGEMAAVDGVSLAIERGEMVTLLGPSGCGKTTTLRLIAGFEQPTDGRILLDGRELQRLPPHRRGMAMVFQSYALFPHLTVFENVAYGLRVQKQPAGKIRGRVARALDLVDLRGLENRAPNQLSGGQQQRVALARALVTEPQVLLFDEPLSNLDATLREQMRFQIRQLQQRLAITAVYVTHDQAEAMVLSDRVVVMNRGRVAQVGPPAEVYRRPAERFVAAFLGRANFLPARVVQGAPSPAVDVLGSRFPAVSQTPLQPAAAVTVVLRPEAMAVEPLDKGQAPPGTLRGTIRRAAFLGPVIDYEVALGDASDTSETLLTVHDRDVRRMEPLPAGAAVALRPLTEALYVLPAEER
jgi:iron(III) transport system ATP-binding protein